MKKIKVMTVFGTRPEAIKMAPLIKELAKYPEKFDSIVTVSAQHRQMLDQVLVDFQIIPNHDLDIMKAGQTLADITSAVLTKLTEVLENEKPDIVLVHGDTTTSFAAALAAFYQQIPIGHVEAGLRTWEKYSPFPEELNRQLVDGLADIYFAPTLESKENLLKEHREEDHIYVTGNTAIDAMNYTIDKEYKNKVLDNITEGHRLVLLTMHRRENLGKPMEDVFKAVRQMVEETEDIEVIFPMHKNPKVRQVAKEYLADIDRVHLIEPLDVEDFQNFAARSYLILTDSGGVQEEAPSLGVPVLVLRDTTERPEGIKAGTLKLVGTDEKTVYTSMKELLSDETAYKKMAHAQNPYGDGKASQRIVESIAYEFQQTTDLPSSFQQ
ncbi:UDP-N-acetylglucosamine 2-epimerase [Enterococcus moraviensis ATCC BAA-383]|uniref:UDP-N-acetylglucosamine 2-epimerase (non-hydrolyzing) n=1 Tax=Enterococcus moraviensis ATCC BAA-383 TaxID=1158609 RepID=R2SVT6_9ENTE|nr:UDP-N-acetylglucosamine 2-epimerase (non-hydrolyzing) [Enterococcus moraviensis]EOH96906.1 UDP-N-acetylglucosamine 2-epimerase [Enterococcus moraviensis ATCC BAA-383]EOT71479.1 UDP-N-acetylglucosamine 2-epimerase [Enterococcus moraviensis ATCC BAA-383]OJG68532.1 UDP-N-acetylglucosamine 2-epimerase [Enterococcus moraviensis]